MQIPLPKIDLPRLPFTPEQASTIAGHVDALYLYLILITLFFSILVVVLIFYFAVRYRRRTPDEIPPPVEGSLVLETVWTITPLLIAMTIFVWGASLYFALYRPPTDATEIFVVGKQWMWKFQHTEGLREINELHVPVGAKIKLTMTTEDVIHALAVPAFRIRADVVPGRYTYLWFEATKTGRFHLFCTEYCGTNHSGMNGWVVVQDPAEYQAWLSGGASESPAAQGEKLFQSLGCASCHKMDVQGRGPMLIGLYGKPQKLDNGQDVIADDAYIRESILDPQAKRVLGFGSVQMPSFRGQVTEEQILELIAYIHSLAAPQGGGTANTAAPASGSTTTSGIAPDTQRSNPVGPTSPRTQRNTGGAMQPANANANTPRGTPPP